MEAQHLPVLVSCGRAKVALGGAEDRLPEENMQRAGSKDGGWVYTEQDPGVQNGNSGSIDREPKLRHAPLQPGGEDGNLAYILE
jgi:hypothetical protein